jgi:hypothetical protein
MTVGELRVLLKRVDDASMQVLIRLQAGGGELFMGCPHSAAPAAGWIEEMFVIDVNEGECNHEVQASTCDECKRALEEAVRAIDAITNPPPQGKP